MGKASSSKKVARAARTGGGRTRRGSSSWGWPLMMGLVVVLGTAGIVYSKEQRQPDNSRPRAGGVGHPGDHWHAALGFDFCGTFQPNINDQADPQGIHTHGDGVVHIHPGATAAGKRATLSVFFSAVHANVSATQVQLPGDQARKNGQKCGDKAAVVRVKTWASGAPDAKSTELTGNPSDIHPKDGELITIAFVPKDAEIPRPPSADQLSKLNDVGASATSTTTPGPGAAPGDTTPAGSTPPESTPTELTPGASTVPPSVPGVTPTPTPSTPDTSAPAPTTGRP